MITRSVFIFVLLDSILACSNTTATFAQVDTSDKGGYAGTLGRTTNGGIESGGAGATGSGLVSSGGATSGGSASGAGTSAVAASGGATPGAAGQGPSSAGGAANGGATVIVTSSGGVTAAGSTATVTGGAGISAGGANIIGTGGTAIAGAPGTACVAGAVKCGGAEVETTVLKCGAAQTEFTATAYCSDSGSQCNPTTGTCFKLGIDPTEVTRAQYAAFIAAGGTVQEVACASTNTSLAPDAACLAQTTVCQGSGCDSHPQVCIDWCDAYAYCSAHGRRLCGRIGGGMNPFDRFADAGSSQWMNGCSAGGQYKYGSGNRVDSGPQYCNYAGTQLGTTHAVGTRVGCTSPSPTYDTLFDLSGNVAEWEDSCEHAIDSSGFAAADACRTRGGSFASALAALSCDTVPASALRRDAVSPEVGFRCCAK